MAKILVIEDETAVRQMVLRALREDGNEVLGAENGLEGVEKARACLPDLVICDVRMDKLDGYGTLAALRKDPTTKTIPFILMTGQADRAGMRQGMELGADDYLPKPFTVGELRAAARARLQKVVILKQQSDERLDNLRANISWALPHELRTPLNGIMGFAEMIVTDFQALRQDEIVAMSQAIYDSAKRLHRMIENTLLYAQIELAEGDEEKAGSFRRSGSSDLGDIASVTGRQRAHTSGRAADLRLTVVPANVAMAEEHLTRIVDELTDNAFKFSDPGTPVEVVVRREAERAVLVISDLGRGMKAEHIANVGAYMQFERRFYEQQGSGLGLAIVKRLAEVHCGTVSLRSELNVGTEVTVTLPLAPNSSESHP